MRGPEGVASPPGTATIYDVARRAGVSIASVSRVLNERGSPRLDTRERVLQAVRELGFVRDGAARALSSGLKQVVAVAFRRGEDVGFEEEAESPLFDEMVLRGVAGPAQRAHFDVLVSLLTDLDAARRLPELARRADGLILHDRLLPADAVAQLAAHVPVVTLGGAALRVAHSVRCDNAQGMQAIVRHLGAEHGYRSIGYLSGHADSPDSMERAQAAEAEADALGLELIGGPEWRGDYSAEGGARVVAAALAAGRPLPRAIVCANDQTALGVMHALGRNGLHVPTDVAVTGFDDVAIARHLRPPLTTVQQPIREMGARAFEVIHAAILGRPAPPADVVLPVRLVVRESCGCTGVAQPSSA